MAIFDLFSKRQRRARGEEPDVYQYETLPTEFRAQVIHILRDLFVASTGMDRRSDEAFKTVHDILCREYGRLGLSQQFRGSGHWGAAVFEFLLSAQTEEVLDAIEIAMRLGVELGADLRFMQYGAPIMTPAQAAAELNQRFRERGIGYQFESNQIVRIDSQVLHADVVRPALQLLAAAEFSAANSEFLKAHEHHRHSRNAECMNECLKALESTLKVICAKRRWSYNATDTASTLIGVVFSKGLIPEWLQSEFSALRSTLESGVPTGRNRVSAHGQGVTPRAIPPHLAAYALHLTAAAIVFLVESSNSL